MGKCRLETFGSSSICPPSEEGPSSGVYVLSTVRVEKYRGPEPSLAKKERVREHVREGEIGVLLRQSWSG